MQVGTHFLAKREEQDARPHPRAAVFLLDPTQSGATSPALSWADHCQQSPRRGSRASAGSFGPGSTEANRARREDTGRSPGEAAAAPRCPRPPPAPLPCSRGSGGAAGSGARYLLRGGERRAAGDSGTGAASARKGGAGAGVLGAVGAGGTAPGPPRAGGRSGGPGGPRLRAAPSRPSSSPPLRPARSRCLPLRGRLSRSLAPRRSPPRNLRCFGEALSDCAPRLRASLGLAQSLQCLEEDKSGILTEVNALQLFAPGKSSSETGNAFPKGRHKTHLHNIPQRDEKRCMKHPQKHKQHQRSHPVLAGCLA